MAGELTPSLPLAGRDRSRSDQGKGARPAEAGSTCPPPFAASPLFPPRQGEGGALDWRSAQVVLLPGGRLHLQHGPIDLVIRADGEAADVRRACAAAAERFRSVLTELTTELPLLRRPLAGAKQPEASSSIARRMILACWPHRAIFITPMAAVAGSVADDIKSVMLAAAPGLRTLYVNNGGDIAVHVAVGERLRIGLVPDLEKAMPEGVVTLAHESGIGGIATSGWRGRSFSLGVADAVTVLARSAAEADAAATIIANAVDVEDPAIYRAPARSLDPDSDLADLPVTTDVGPLADERIASALAAGARAAQGMLDARMIADAALSLQGHWRIVEARSGLLSAMA
jgi:uncharacterized protein